VTDHGGLVEPQRDDQIPWARGVSAQGVVAVVGFGRQAVPEQIRRDHMGVGAQQRHHRQPRRGAAGEPVQLHDDRTAAVGALPR